MKKVAAVKVLMVPLGSTKLELLLQGTETKSWMAEERWGHLMEARIC